VRRGVGIAAARSAGISDERNLLARMLLEGSERRKDAHQGVHRGWVILVHVAELEQALPRREVVRPQDELALEVLDLVKR